MKDDKKQVAGTVMALTGGTCWGFSGYCGQYLSEQKGIEAPWLMVVRLFSADIILVPVGFKFHDRGNLKVLRKKRDTVYSLVFAISGVTLCRFTYLMAVQAPNTGTAIVLQYLSPILILAVVRMRKLRLPKGSEPVVIGLSLFGTFVIDTHGDIHSSHITGGALFWDLLAAVSSMIHTIIPGGLVLKYNIYQVPGFDMLFGGTAMGAMVRPWNYGTAQDTDTVGALAGVVVTGTTIAFGLYLQSVSVIGPLRGSTMGSVEPVSAVVISVFWLGARFTLPDFLGFALILGAVFVLTFAYRPREEMTGGADFSVDSRKIPKSLISGII